jgi:predicted DNA-binding antitoxin AbrB/MazE fold protein
MTKTIEAVFDGSVLLPQESLPLAANTRVRLTIETLPPASDTPVSFLQVARSLELEGPSDWSSKLEQYLNDGVEPTRE